jgi:Dolichyl-phosphate-mannose-protein mannosyltransferase
MTSPTPATGRSTDSGWASLRGPAFIFLFAAGLRVFVLLVLVAHSHAWWGINEAGTIGGALVRGKGFISPFHDASGPSAWFAPVYPTIMASIFLVFGFETTASAWVAALLNVLFASLTVLVIRQLGHENFGEEAGDIAAWVWAVSPPLLIMPWLLWETCISGLLMSFALLRLLRLNERSRLRGWMFCGCIWGFAGLLNPALLAPFPALGLRAAWRGCGRGVSSMLLTGALVIVPWTVRNELALRQFALVRSNLWPELFFANAGFAFHPHGGSMLYQQEGEAAFSVDMRNRFTDYLDRHWQEFLRRTGRRIVEFWIEPTNFGPCAALLSLAGFAGLLRARLVNREWASFASVLAFYPILYYFTFTFSRFRYPMEPVIYVLAGYAISELIAYGRRRTGSGRAA